MCERVRETRLEKYRARLANKGARLVKQGGEFSCWDF